jgi:hypothetical protein
MAAKVKVNVGTPGFCVKKIREYMDASTTDPDLANKKKMAEKALENLEALFGIPPVISEEATLNGCSNELWVG